MCSQLFILMKMAYNTKKKESYFRNSLSFLVIRLGLEPKTPTLKVLCSTC